MNGIQGLLKSLLSKNPILKQGIEEARILSFWPEAVGPAIAQKTRPIGFKDNALIVAVEHPIWKQELMTNKKRILENFRKASGYVQVNDLFLVDREYSVPVKNPQD